MVCYLEFYNDSSSTDSANIVNAGKRFNRNIINTYVYMEFCNKCRDLSLSDIL